MNSSAQEWLPSAVVRVFRFLTILLVLQWSQNLPCWKAGGLCWWFTNQAAILFLHQNYWPRAKRRWKQGKYEKQHHVNPGDFVKCFFFFSNHLTKPPNEWTYNCILADPFKIPTKNRHWRAHREGELSVSITPAVERELLVSSVRFFFSSYTSAGW